MTHDELVKRAIKWLQAPHRTVSTPYRTACSPVFGERRCMWVSEEPDAIGWEHRGSTLIECKVSREDFKADKYKQFRKIPADGVGRLRYYMVPLGLLCEEDLPPNWGLLGVTLKTVRVIREATPVEYSMRREILFLRAAFYNLTIAEPPTEDILAAHQELQMRLRTML